MTQTKLQKAFFMRRRHAARRRRGWLRRTGCNVTHLNSWRTDTHHFGQASDRLNLRLLDRMAQNLCGYPHVRGLLYRLNGATIDVLVIAPAPMTRPMETLAQGLAARLSESCPQTSWLMHSTANLPSGWEAEQWRVWSLKA